MIDLSLNSKTKLKEHLKLKTVLLNGFIIQRISKRLSLEVHQAISLFYLLRERLIKKKKKNQKMKIINKNLQMLS